MVWWGGRDQAVHQTSSKTGQTRKSGSSERGRLVLCTPFPSCSVGGMVLPTFRVFPPQVSLSRNVRRHSERCVSEAILSPGKLTVKIHHTVLSLASAARSLLNVIIGSVLFFLGPPVLLKSASTSPLVLHTSGRGTSFH